MPPLSRIYPLFRLLPLLAGAALLGCQVGTLGPEAEQQVGNDFLFCFWNAENFFDDRLDGWRNRPDEEYDAWFADNPAILKEKLDNLSKALAEMNGGKGPDILALAEVESARAAELLKEALNARIGKKAPPYKNVLFKNAGGGRHISTAIITRLAVDNSKTRLHGRRLRILEGHVEANGHDLVILATHWTSRVSDVEGEGRDKYGDQSYGVFRAMYKNNPQVDFLVCGDFNDPPDDESVTKHLRAIGDLDRVKEGGSEPHLYHLFANWVKEGKKPEGSHFYRGKWMLFDQIAVSPGLLDNEGWTCEVETARIVGDLTADNRGRPKRFGSEKDKFSRGWSDHFPVTVRLKVADK
jgi:endonuclease/exonuclease/phosphatase family metal-dependent hydrolase